MDETANGDTHAQAQLLAAALYEVRLILGPGSQRPDGEPRNEAAALAYALHNEALAILEGRDFDEDAVWQRLAGMDKRLGTETAERLRFHISASQRRRESTDDTRAHRLQIEHFASAALEFCELVESGNPDAFSLAKAMSQLHSAAPPRPPLHGAPRWPAPHLAHRTTRGW